MTPVIEIAKLSQTIPTLFNIQGVIKYKCMHFLHRHATTKCSVLNETSNAK